MWPIDGCFLANPWAAEPACQGRPHASRREKGELLDDFCEITQYTRKHALVLLGDPPVEEPPRSVGGRPLSYGPAEVALLRMCWSATDGICSKRLAPFLPELLELVLTQSGGHP